MRSSPLKLSAQFMGYMSVLLLCASGLAQAANAEAASVKADSTRVDAAEFDKPVPSANDNTTPQTTSNARVDNAAGAQASAEAVKSQTEEKQASFNVFEFKVDGNTVLSTGKIEQAVYGYLGESKTIDDVEKARSALEKAYQDEGYLTVSVSIPQQEVDAGIVTLKVTEGEVEKLRVVDSKYSSLAEIKSRIGEFNEGKVPHFPTAQQQLGTVNRGQNRVVTPVLRPGKSPGKVEVDLQVQDKLPLHGSLELNDRYSPNTTETRLNGAIRYENLWQKDHSLGLSFQVSPQDLNEVKVLSGTYVIPRMNGDYFAAYGVISDSDIAAVGDVNVVGNGYIAGARYIHPLPVSENFYHSLTLGADYKVFKENVVLQGADDSIDTPISYLVVSAGYDSTWQTSRSQTQMNVVFNFAPRGLGNTEQEFNEKRNDAQPNFAFLRADVKHLHTLPLDWVVQAKLTGQVASDALISPEQLAIGGVDSVRGYLESSELGDNGVLASLELRTPSMKKFIKANRFSDYIKELYAFAFLDAGYTKIYNAAGEDANRELYSAGLGLKLKTNSGLFTNLDYAHAMKESGDVNEGDDRVHFRVGYEW